MIHFTYNMNFVLLFMKIYKYKSSTLFVLIAIYKICDNCSFKSLQSY